MQGIVTLVRKNVRKSSYYLLMPVRLINLKLQLGLILLRVMKVQVEPSWKHYMQTSTTSSRGSK